jgi:hypothetical protein
VSTLGLVGHHGAPVAGAAAGSVYSTVQMSAGKAACFKDTRNPPSQHLLLWQQLAVCAAQYRSVLGSSMSQGPRRPSHHAVLVLQITCVSSAAGPPGSYSVTVVVDGAAQATRCCYTYSMDYTPSLYPAPCQAAALLVDMLRPLRLIILAAAHAHGSQQMWIPCMQ